MKILIDNGHGSETPGKRSPDGLFRECNYTREIAAEVVYKLRKAGYDAELLVPELYDVKLIERVHRANVKCQSLGARNVLLVSIHNNAAGNGKEWLNGRGWEAWTSNGKTEADKLRADTEIECEQKRADCDASVSRTRMEVEEEASYIRERLSVAAGDLLASVSTDLHANTENCIRELTACVEDMQYEIKALFSRLTSRSAEMNDRIDYYQNCVAEGVGMKLAEMDEKYGIRPLMSPADGENNAGE